MLSAPTLSAYSVPLWEIDHMTRKEFAETTKDAVAVGLWTALFVFTIMVGLVVWQGIVVF